MEIAKQNTQLATQRENWLIVNTLDAYQQKMLKFFEAPAVNATDEPTLKKVIDSAITVIFQDLGKPTAEDDDMDYMVTQIYDFVLDQYPSLRINEIKPAFQRGVAKEYGEYYGVNTASLKLFIKGYMACQLRADAVKRYMALKDQLNLKPEPTDAEKEQLTRDNIIIAFDRYKRTGGYHDHYNVVFHTLHSAGVVGDFTDQEIEDFYQEAKKRLINYHGMEVGISFYNRKENASRITEIKNLAGVAMTKDKELTAEVNRVALCHFFEKLVKNGVEITEVLDFI